MRAMIFGASGGLGAALARRYAAAGFSVAPVGRQECDLADARAVERFLAGPLETPDVCLLVAGSSQAGYVDEAPVDAFAACMQVNFLSPVAIFSRLARAAKPCPSFVFALSGAADLLVPGLAPYGLGKRALRDYLEIAGLEKAFPNSHVLRVWPGGMKTDFDRKTKIHGRFRLYPPRKPRDPDEVAGRIFEAERAGRRELVLSPAARWLGRLQALTPAAAGRLVKLLLPG